MKSKILLILTFGALVIAGGCYAYYKNFVELSTEYYTVKVVVPSEYDEEYSYKTGVEVKVETTIPRKHQYISDDEAVKAEQNYADGFRETCKEDMEYELEKGTSKFDFKVRFSQRESDARYYLIKLSHTKNADLNGLWEIVKSKGVYDNEWEVYCKLNDITCTFIPLKNVKSY